MKIILMFIGAMIVLAVFPFAFTWYIITSSWEANINILETIDRQLQKKYFP